MMKVFADWLEEELTEGYKKVRAIPANSLNSSNKVWKHEHPAGDFRVWLSSKKKRITFPMGVAWRGNEDDFLAGEYFTAGVKWRKLSATKYRGEIAEGITLQKLLTPVAALRINQDVSSVLQYPTFRGLPPTRPVLQVSSSYELYRGELSTAFELYLKGAYIGLRSMSHLYSAPSGGLFMEAPFARQYGEAGIDMRVSPVELMSGDNGYWLTVSPAYKGGSALCTNYMRIFTGE